MKKIINKPENVVTEMLDGLAYVHSDLEQYPSRGPCHPLPSPTGYLHLTLFGPLP